jgi:hypothetical protein
VNKRELVNIQGPLEAGALRVLREIPGLTVSSAPLEANRGLSAVLRFGGSETPVAVEFKLRVNAATAWHVVQQTARSQTQRILVAHETTEEAREILVEHGIAVVDGFGNAHIELPGLLFHVEARRRSAKTAPTRLAGRAGVAAQALLLRPERDWKVSELATVARVSVGFAHRVLARLEDEAIVAAEGSGPARVRRVTNPTALLDLWTEENFERPTRTLAFLLSQTPQQLIRQLGKNLDAAGTDYALTGAAAASLVAPFVTAIPVVETWVSAAAAQRELCDAVGAEQVRDGHNLVFLQAKGDTPLAFCQRQEGLWLANRFRLYFDLRADPRRGREQAENLRKEVIGF